MYDGHAGSRDLIAFRSARAASAMEPMPGMDPPPLSLTVADPVASPLPPLIPASAELLLSATSSAAVDMMASITRSFHCVCCIVSVASLLARENARARSKVGWLRILE